MNTLKAPGQWQQLEIVLQAPQFQDGKKVANARFVKVTLNGVVIVDAQTDHPALRKPKGPLGFMGHHEHVEFRNLRIKDLDEETPRK